MPTIAIILILSIVQGFTEFLPISSSTHLTLIPKLFGFQDPGTAVDAFLHLGTLLVVIIYFRKDVWGLVLGTFKGKKLPWAIALANLPVIVCGLLFKDFFTSDLMRSVNSIVITLILGSLVMLIAEKISKRNQEIKDLSFMQVFFIGCMQTLALFPGFSRSGSTISAGLITNLKREDATKFSFLLGLPAVAGAGLLSLKDLMETGTEALIIPWTELLIGFAVTFIVGYLTIDLLMKYLKNNSLMVFIIYRIVLAGFLYLWTN